MCVVCVSIPVDAGSTDFHNYHFCLNQPPVADRAWCVCVCVCVHTYVRAGTCVYMLLVLLTLSISPPPPPPPTPQYLLVVL